MVRSVLTTLPLRGDGAPALGAAVAEVQVQRERASGSLQTSELTFHFRNQGNSTKTRPPQSAPQ